MKKIPGKPVILAAALAVLAYGCGPSGGSRHERGESAENQSLRIAIAHSGAAGGMWHAAAEGIAEILREAYPGSSISVIPGSSDGNLARLQKGEIQLGFSASDSANSAITGVELFSEPVSADEVKAFCLLYYSRLQFFMMERTGIRSIEELKEKRYPLRLSVGPRGSGMELGARRILKEYGITYDDIRSWGGRVVHIGTGDSARMMGDGQLDAYFCLSIVPTPAFAELDLKRDFTVLGIREDVIEKMAAEFDYIPGMIPEGSYRGVREDTPTVLLACGLYASGRLDEQTAYLIARAVLENIEKLGMIHAQMKGLTPEFMTQNMVFPFHPGAQRAYDEHKGARGE